MKKPRTVTFPVYIQAKPDKSEWDNGPCKVDGMELVARNWHHKPDLLIDTIEVTVKLPHDWNPVGIVLNKLNEDKNNLLAETQMKLNAINDQIGKLQALTFESADT